MHIDNADAAADTTFDTSRRARWPLRVQAGKVPLSPLLRL
jgi:hypothetical protein